MKLNILALTLLFAAFYTQPIIGSSQKSCPSENDDLAIIRFHESSTGSYKDPVSFKEMLGWYCTEVTQETDLKFKVRLSKIYEHQGLAYLLVESNSYETRVIHDPALAKKICAVGKVTPPSYWVDYWSWHKKNHPSSPS